jgi:hypothetical protein
MNNRIVIAQYKNIISLSSRTDSTNSLERTANGDQSQVNYYDSNSSNNNVAHASINSQNNQILNPNFANSNEIAQQIDKTVLLNKVLALQNQLSKLRSRIEFLEEHNATLLEDIKKKSKLIQFYIVKDENGGALSSNRFKEF